MNGFNELSRDAKNLIIDKCREYVEAIFLNKKTPDYLYFTGAFRGYIHGLGASGVIPRHTEFSLCKIDFNEIEKLRRAVVSVCQLLQDGFSMVETRQTGFFDELYNLVMEG